jgi:dTDP-4-dehydrorhamnose reductase
MGDEKIVILGGRGMLATDVVAFFKRKGSEVTVLDIPEFDITRPNDIESAIHGAQTVINCAAYTNVEKAEEERDLAFSVNAEAVGRLGKIAKAGGQRVLHISTDFVFNGQTEKPYTEDDEPDPVNVYGQSKLEGEKLLIESGCQCCIMRIQWTYGAAGNNFIKKLISFAEANDEVNVVEDQVGSPTATTAVAKAIWDMVENQADGIYHFAAEGNVSRYEMAKFIFDELKLKAKVVPCKSSEFQSKAQRPLSSRFDCNKIKRLLTEPIEHWQEPLRRYVRTV